MTPEIEILIYIFIITTIITCVAKYYSVLWNINDNLKKQNELIAEQNKLQKEYIEFQKFKGPINS